MICTAKKAAKAVGGKTARACDSCLSKRARWYCAADDAFLCQNCDLSVHSANQLARRHLRVRLDKAPNAKSNLLGSADQLDSVLPSVPAWHHGFTRKARTPRSVNKPAKLALKSPKKEEAKMTKINKITLPFVPEIGSEEGCPEDNDHEQLLYRVPVFAPFAAGLCDFANDVEISDSTRVRFEEGEAASDHDFASEMISALLGGNNGNDIEEKEEEDASDLKNLDGFLESDVDLVEFAADVECLLGKGVDEGSGGIDGLALFDHCKEEVVDDGLVLKVEADHYQEATVASQWDVGAFDRNFGCESQLDGKEGGADIVESEVCKSSRVLLKRNELLRLNYEAVIAAWSSHVSPWTNGSRPELNLEAWPDFLGSFPTSSSCNQPCGGVGGQTRISDEGREGRVSRYREKKRTRLFSKKIRYQVRKLNAEKRPRMKGRFVKRATFAGTPAYPSYLMMNK